MRSGGFRGEMFTDSRLSRYVFLRFNCINQAKEYSEHDRVCKKKSPFYCLQSGAGIEREREKLSY